jgi:ABC-2 type transport system ATP-binding protein
VITQEARSAAHSSTAKGAVVVSDLVKTYATPDGGEFNAVDGMHFAVEAGEVFGILGPNGAGKTTTLEIIEGVKRPTSGTATVLGMDIGRDARRISEAIGVQLQAASYFEHLRLGEILELFGSFYEQTLPAEQLLEMVGLTEKRNALVRELSGGQAQRFSIVAALVNDPEIVFLDEPTTGLDPQARRNLWEVIQHLNSDLGKTVVLTTHYMEEAEVLSHRVGIVDAGRMVSIDTPAGLIAGLGVGNRIEFGVDGDTPIDGIERLPGFLGVSPIVNGTVRYRASVEAPNLAVPALYQWARDHNTELLDVKVRSATLEDVFLATTGKKLRD